MANRNAGSFRDTGGYVYEVDGRIFRTVLPPAAGDFEYVESTGLIQRLIDKRWLIDQRIISAGESSAFDGAVHVLEHPRIPFISYPYEWSFAELKAAALLHLRVHIEALKLGVNLSDASAYNIQFDGTRPIFIDLLSFRRYREGEFWNGHHQFCQQFLNPLLLRALVGLPHNAWYRGTLEGISAGDLAAVLPWRRKLSMRVMLHVVLQARFQRKTRRSEAKQAMARKLPRQAFINMLQGIVNWIESLKPHDAQEAVWKGYSCDNSYSDAARESKYAFVSLFVAETRPVMLWDLGCNDGEFSRVALESGAQGVIGFEGDTAVLEQAYEQARIEGLNFLPLHMDLANPSPSQGWAERERAGMQARSPADAILALALIHHLCITRNVPLSSVIAWLVGLAPCGVIEWVPKADPMVQELLSLREDIFTDYTEEQFLACIEREARIVRTQRLEQSGRLLVWFQHRVNV